VHIGAVDLTRRNDNLRHSGGEKNVSAALARQDRLGAASTTGALETERAVLGLISWQIGPAIRFRAAPGSAAGGWGLSDGARRTGGLRLAPSTLRRDKVILVGAVGFEPTTR
jgi:hypothetical protein